MKETINYEYKDSLFKILFGEYKENALSLYNALSGKDYNDPDALIITTLKNAVYIGRKNDVSFIIESDMVLNEHQSSQNPNMPLRGLEYFAELYSNYINKIPGGRKRLYSSTLVIIPAPKYFVLYNGKKKIPERHILKLSDAYEGEGDIEVIAHVININKGCNPEVM